jgi:hypothetical protein
MVVGDAIGLRVLPGPFSGDRRIDDAASVTVKPTPPAAYGSVGVTSDRDGNGLTDLLLAEPGAVWSVSIASGILDASEGTRLYAGIPDEDGNFDDTPSILGGDFDADGLGDVAIAEPWAHYDTRLSAGGATILWGDLDIYVPPLVSEDRTEDLPQEAPDTGHPVAPARAVQVHTGCASVAWHPAWLGMVFLAVRRAPVTRRRSSRTP